MWAVGRPEWEPKWITRLVLIVSESIFNSVWFVSKVLYPRQFDALLARLHQQSIIFATIALGYPKSAFESFQWLRGSSVFWVTLPRWHILDRWFVLKPYILQHHKWSWVSKESNYGISVTECQAWRPSIIAVLRLCDSAFNFKIATISRTVDDCLLEAGFLGCQQPLAEA